MLQGRISDQSATTSSAGAPARAPVEQALGLTPIQFGQVVPSLGIVVEWVAGSKL